MKKFLFSLIVCCFTVATASAQSSSNDDKITVNAGFLFPSTLNATVGYEHSLQYGHAVELYADIGDHWQQPTSDRFWKGYYWDGGLVYKHRLVRYKNASLRFRFGPQFGAVQRDFFLGVEGSFEFSHVFKSGWEFTVTQKNNVNFLNGDTFRNGLLIGFKAPL